MRIIILFLFSFILAGISQADQLWDDIQECKKFQYDIYFESINKPLEEITEKDLDEVDQKMYECGKKLTQKYHGLDFSHYHPNSYAEDRKSLMESVEIAKKIKKGVVYTECQRNCHNDFMNDCNNAPKNSKGDIPDENYQIIRQKGTDCQNKCKALPR